MVESHMLHVGSIPMACRSRLEVLAHGVRAPGISALCHGVIEKEVGVQTNAGGTVNHDKSLGVSVGLYGRAEERDLKCSDQNDLGSICMCNIQQTALR